VILSVDLAGVPVDSLDFGGPRKADCLLDHYREHPTMTTNGIRISIGKEDAMDSGRSWTLTV
jgi:hypothetical protein